MNSYEKARQMALSSGKEFTEGIPAGNVKSGQVIMDGADWFLVVSVYKHPLSPYNKMLLIPLTEIERYRREEIRGQYHKIYENLTVYLVKEEFVVNISTIEAVEKSSALAKKIGDYHQLMLSSNDRIEVLPDVLIDKSVVAKALLNEATALNRQIGELLKKI